MKHRDKNNLKTKDIERPLTLLERGWAFAFCEKTLLSIQTIKHAIASYFTSSPNRRHISQLQTKPLRSMSSLLTKLFDIHVRANERLSHIAPGAQREDPATGAGDELLKRDMEGYSNEYFTALDEFIRAPNLD